MEYSTPAHKKGPAIITHVDEGISHWMPDPSLGYTSTIISPFNSEVTHFSFGIQRLEPGEILPEHHHRQNEELFYVYQGEGTVTVDGKTAKIGPGTTLYCGRNVAHTFENTGKEPLEFCWFFTPAGLENVLDGIGAHRKPGEPRPNEVPFPQQRGQIVTHITTRGRAPGAA